MSKTRNKSASKWKHDGAARRGSPSRHKRPFAIGDRVRVVDIPEDLKDSNYDLKDGDYREMRTAELFRFCLGREFTVQGFDKFGYVELRAERGKFKLQFEVNGQTYFLAFEEAERRWYVFAPNVAEVRRIPVYVDAPVPGKIVLAEDGKPTAMN